MTDQYIALEKQYCAQNYSPLPVVLTKGEGAYLWDDEGKRYIDMVSAYSAVSHGYCHPKLVAELTHQANRLAVCSRAFHTDKLGVFLELACNMFGYEKALPMNSGAEAVETAIKAARKWAYTRKGVPADQAEVIVCQGNFHGRTTMIVGMSSEPQYREGFGPFAPGFCKIPYGDASALEAAITPNTAAFLVEPIQGEAGIIVPPKGYLHQCAEICRRHNVLLICDEIQTGLGRTGRLLACQHENVKPDAIVIGKALGGGLLPISMFLTRKEVMDVFTPGDHGSTFGGSPLACAVGKRALELLEEEHLIERAAELGGYFMEQLKQIKSAVISEIRGQGLLMGLAINPDKAQARDICLKLIERGVLSKETHKTVIRLAPPLVITKEQLDFVVAQLKEILSCH
jgi:ornithine--oxo-acid transaminase